MLQCYLNINAQGNTTIAFYCSCSSKSRKQFTKTIKKSNHILCFLHQSYEITKNLCEKFIISA